MKLMKSKAQILL